MHKHPRGVVHRNNRVSGFQIPAVPRVELELDASTRFRVPGPELAGFLRVCIVDSIRFSLLTPPTNSENLAFHDL